MTKINQTNIKNIIPVILSGGAGSRLWPLSRNLRPKQFLPINSDKTLFQETALRLANAELSAPLVLCNHEHRFMVAEQFREINIQPRNIVLEPVPRNTAPAIAAAASMIAAENPEGILLVLPSDHVIESPDQFHQAITIAAKAAQDGKLVTFGIKPTRPETGYGYIRRGEALEKIDGCFDIARFVEKPDVNTAQEFLDSHEYSWNSGIFMFQVGTFLEELNRQNPEIFKRCEQAVQKGRQDLDFFRLDEDIFSSVKSQSVDYAVMEHAQHAAVVPVEMGWSDVGSWTALWEIGKKDQSGNIVTGDVLLEDVRDCYVRSDKPLVAVLGIENAFVIATDDAVLVASKERAQDVRRITERLKAEGRSEHEIHTKVFRPWGYYMNLDHGDRFLVKQLMVNPGAQLSLQRHKHRSEHWIVVSGTAKVTNGEQEILLQENQSTYIPLSAWHRLENPADDPLIIIEVQSGDYIGEDDIERRADDYGRA